LATQPHLDEYRQINADKDGGKKKANESIANSRPNLGGTITMSPSLK
jgi:hypothetical protein